MKTIPLALDGYTDLPPGKIANVVTYLEMTAPPASTPATCSDPTLILRRIEHPDLAWYRQMFRRIGERWLWFSRAVMPESELRALLNNPALEIYVPERNGDALGIAELDRGKAGEVEITLFGVVPEATGTGVARWLMSETLALAFRPGVERVWLHTCSFDHPAAIRFYLTTGFRAFKYAIEVSDDPRLTGHLDRTAAPHVPLID